jgi:hypothetical protein
MKAAASVAALPGPAKRKATAVNKSAAATGPLKKTKVKKPGPRNYDQTIWKRFSELCQYKADHGTMRVPWTNAGSNNIIANWVHSTRNRYANNILSVVYMDGCLECSTI